MRSDLDHSRNTGIVWFRDFIFPNFLFNRIDKNNDYVQYQPVYDTIKTVGSPDSVILSKVLNSFDVIKYATFVLNGKIVPVTFKFPKSRLALDFTTSLYKLKVQDSLNPSKLFSPVYSLSTGWDIYFDTKYSDKEFPFNLRVLFGSEYLKVMDNYFTQVDGASLTPDGSKQVAYLINESGRRASPIWRLSVNLQKNLGFKDSNNENDNSGQYLFFRFNYSWQKFKGNTAIPNHPGEFESKNFYNHFSQLQLGIDLNFDALFKGTGTNGHQNPQDAVNTPAN